jgi:hypothetical protein
MVVVWVSRSKLFYNTVEPKVWHSVGGEVRRGPGWTETLWTLLSFSDFAEMD